MPIGEPSMPTSEPKSTKVENPAQELVASLDKEQERTNSKKINAAEVEGVPSIVVYKRYERGGEVIVKEAISIRLDDVVAFKKLLDEGFNSLYPSYSHYVGDVMRYGWNIPQIDGEIIDLHDDFRNGMKGTRFRAALESGKTYNTFIASDMEESHLPV